MIAQPLREVGRLGPIDRPKSIRYRCVIERFIVSLCYSHYALSHRVYPPPRGSEVLWGEVAHFLH